MDMFKKGNASTMSSSRDIVLNNAIAKHHHKCLRGRLADIVEPLLPECQFAGRKGMGTDMAAHLVRTF